MILRTRLIHLFFSLVLFTTFTAAWPWPPTYENIEGFLLRRDDSNSDSSATQGSSAAPSGQSAAPSNSNAATTGSAAAATSGEPQSNSQSGSGGPTKIAQTGSKAGKNTASATSAAITDVDPRLPAGGVNMLTPSLLAASTYYKIGTTVTFGWNYTSLSIPPSKIDILVTCSTNNALYTLSNNVSFASTGSVQWDTAPEETGVNPLLTGEYNLIIHDAAKDPSVIASAGQLAAFTAQPIGMYLKQTYVSRDQWVCPVAGCNAGNAALSDTERQAMKFMFGMVGITVLSFTWFVGGLGAFI